MGAKDIDIKIKGFNLAIILVYLIILFFLFLYSFLNVMAFTPVLYHILHAIVIGCATFAACYKEMIAKEEVKFFTTIGIVLIFVFLAFVGTEGILRFSTLFLNKGKPSVECVRISSTYYTKHNTPQAIIEMPDHWGMSESYNITQKEKTFIDKHINSCVCLELLLYKSPLFFLYTEFGKKKGVIKLCDEKKSSSSAIAQ